MKRKQTGIFKWLGCFLLLLATLGGAGCGNDDDVYVGDPVLPCDITSLQPTVAADVILDKVEKISTPVAYCRVDGHIVTHGPGLETGLVKFMVALPDKFNSRYFLSALGGSAGTVAPPDAAKLTSGYAVASTDDGSQSPGIDYKFAVNRAKALDWDSRGIHITAVETQAITKAYYGLWAKKQKLYRYIWGCSGGGRSANVEASYYPEDFEGANVGCPGISATNQVFFGYLADSMIKDPSSWIPPATLSALETELIQKYDGVDGAIDGLIGDPNFTFDPATLTTPLTAPQVRTLNIVMNGMNIAGAPTYPGFPPTNPSAWSATLIGMTSPTTWGTALPGVLTAFDTSSRGMFGLTYDFLTQLDFSNPADIKGWVDKYAEVFPASGNQTPAAVNNFKQVGGKIIYWHGVADNAISATDMIRFYDELVVLQNGLANTQTFARMFLPPGVFHGYNAPNAPVFRDVMAQAQDALEQWVEKGKAPVSLVANAAASVNRTFLLCPYPQKSVFKGGVANPQGLDVKVAANWTCQ